MTSGKVGSRHSPIPQSLGFLSPMLVLFSSSLIPRGGSWQVQIYIIIKFLCLSSANKIPRIETCQIYLFLYTHPQSITLDNWVEYANCSGLGPGAKVVWGLQESYGGREVEG